MKNIYKHLSIQRKVTDKILVEWIRMQKEQGYTSQELQEILVQHGYGFLEIQNALREAEQPRESQLEITPQSSTKKILIASVMSAAVLFVGVLVAIFFLAISSLPSSNEIPTKNAEILDDIKGSIEQPLQTSPPQNEKNDATSSEKSNCDIFPEKLVTCEPYECQFTHPMTQELIMRKILGKQERCKYEETIASTIKMECDLSEDLQKRIVEFYRSGARAETENPPPIQDALAKGECVLHQEPVAS